MVEVDIVVAIVLMPDDTYVQAEGCVLLDGSL